MTDIEILKFGNAFITKMHYSFKYSKDKRIDHINKVIYIETSNDKNILFAAVSAILFWHTPKPLYRLLALAYREECYEDITHIKFGKYLVKCLEDIQQLEFKHRTKDIYTYFHPWLNRGLIKSLKEASIILLTKMFDDNDNYFHKKDEGYPIDVTKIDINQKLTDYICNKFGGCITGSIGLACYGTVFRESVHDMDFLVPTCHLLDIMNKCLDYEIKHNRIVGKHRINVENTIKRLFSHTTIYKGLLDIFEEVKIRHCSIDRVTDYDQYVKCTFSLIINGNEYDLIFKSDVNRIYMDNINAYVQSIGDIMYAKVLLGRPKDYKDLMYFEPFQFNIAYKDINCTTLIK